MYKVVRSKRYGGDYISKEIITYFIKICKDKHMKYVYRETYSLFWDKESKDHLFFLSIPKIPRHHPALVEAVEFFLKHYPENECELTVEKIPFDEYYIESDDGLENIITRKNFTKINIDEFKTDGN